MESVVRFRFPSFRVLPTAKQARVNGSTALVEPWSLSLCYCNIAAWHRRPLLDHGVGLTPPVNLFFLRPGEHERRNLAPWSERTIENSLIWLYCINKDPLLPRCDRQWNEPECMDKPRRLPLPSLSQPTSVGVPHRIRLMNHTAPGVHEPTSLPTF